MAMTDKDEKYGADDSANTLPKEDIVLRARRDVRESADTVKKWWTQAKEADNYYAGHQWLDRDDIDIMKGTNRPMIVFNRAQTVINAVLGAELNNRQEVRFVPRQPSDPRAAAFSELATSSLEWVMENTNGHDERSIAFRDMLIRGMGWTETRLEHDVDPDGNIIYERVDGLEMYWDTSARKQNLEDSHWRAHKKWIRLEEAIVRWPELSDEIHAGSLDSQAFEDDVPAFVRNRTDQYREQNRDGQSEMQHRDFVPILRYQYITHEDYYRVAVPAEEQPAPPSGMGAMPSMPLPPAAASPAAPPPAPPQEKIESMSVADYKALQKQIDQKNEEALAAYQARMDLGFENEPPPEPIVLDAVKQRRKIYKEAYILGDLLLQHKTLPINKGFTLNCMTGYYDSHDNLWYGLMRAMIDPQRAANKWLSQGLHIVNTNAKGGVLAEMDAFVDPHKAQNSWASGDGIIWLNEGGIEKIEQRTMTPFPPAFATMMQYAITAFPEVTGVSLDILNAGQQGAEVPGVTMRQQIMAGMTVLAPIFNALTRYRKTEARVIFAFIQEYIADGRLIRVGGPMAAEAVPLMREDLALDYELVVDENPQNPNTKAEVWLTLGPIIPMLLKLNMFSPDLLDFSPLPASVVVKMKQQLMSAQKAAQEQQEKDQQNGQYEHPAEIAARVEKLKADAALSLARAQEIMATLQGGGIDPEKQLEAQRKQVEIQMTQDEHLQNMRSEAARDALHIASVQQDLEAKRERNQMDRDKGKLDATSTLMQLVTGLAEHQAELTKKREELKLKRAESQQRRKDKANVVSKRNS